MVAASWPSISSPIHRVEAGPSTLRLVKTHRGLFLAMLLPLLLATAGRTANAANGFVVIQPKYKEGAVVAPDPNYPPAAEQRGHHGQGIFRLIINDKTGIVDQVQVFKSTGFGELNAEAVMTLFKWKFRPGIKQRDVSVTFESTGTSRNLHG
jgi:TonB family protein